MDGAFGGGAHGVEADERAGRRQNARAFLPGAFDQVPVVQKLRDRQRHEDAAFVDCADGDVTEQCGRQALHHHVAIVGERDRRLDRDGAKLRQGTARFGFVTHGNGGKRQARHAGDQPLRHFQPDRAEPGQSDAQMWFVCRHRHSSSRQPLSVKCILSPAASMRALGAALMPQ